MTVVIINVTSSEGSDEPAYRTGRKSPERKEAPKIKEAVLELRGYLPSVRYDGNEPFGST
jgi:hypothetical protein